MYWFIKSNIYFYYYLFLFLNSTNSKKLLSYKKELVASINVN